MKQWTVLFNMHWPSKNWGPISIERAKTVFVTETKANEFYSWCHEESLVPTMRPYVEGDNL